MVSGSSSLPGSVPQSPATSRSQTPTLTPDSRPGSVPSILQQMAKGMPSIPAGTGGGGPFAHLHGKDGAQATSMTELQKLVNMQPKVLPPDVIRHPSTPTTPSTPGIDMKPLLTPSGEKHTPGGASEFGSESSWESGNSMTCDLGVVTS